MYTPGDIQAGRSGVSAYPMTPKMISPNRIRARSSVAPANRQMTAASEPNTTPQQMLPRTTTSTG